MGSVAPTNILRLQTLTDTMLEEDPLLDLGLLSCVNVCHLQKSEGLEWGATQEWKWGTTNWGMEEHLRDERRWMGVRDRQWGVNDGPRNYSHLILSIDMDKTCFTQRYSYIGLWNSISGIACSKVIKETAINEVLIDWKLYASSIYSHKTPIFDSLIRSKYFLSIT